MSLAVLEAASVQGGVSRAGTPPSEAPSGAAAASLLLIVLVWPFMELVDALSVIMEVGMSSEISIGSPLASIIIASIISAMVWAVAVIIPDA